MSVTKGNLVDVAQTILAGGNNNVKIDSSEISVVADMAIATLIGYKIKENDKESYFDIPDAFVTPFENVEIFYSQTRAEYYSFLPDTLIILSRDAGLRQVSSMRGQNTPFTKMTSSSNSVFSKLEAGKLLGTTYYLEKDKVFYKNLPTLAGGKPAIDKVLIKMVASTSSLDSDDPIPVPAEMESQLLQMVLQMIREENTTKRDDYDDTSTNNTK